MHSIDQNGDHGYPGKIVNSIPQLLFAINWQQDKFLYLSPAYETIWEVAPGTAGITPSDWLDTVHPEDKQQLMQFFDLLNNTRKQDLEFRIVTNSLSHKWLNILAGLDIDDQGNKITTGVIQDITSQREHRETIQHFTDRKNSILQILAHDLMGPLGNIQLSVSMLTEGQQDPETLTSLLKIISQNCTRGVNLIQNLVNEEFLTTSKSDLIRQRIEMVQKMRVIIKQFQQSPKGIIQNFEFICDLDKLYVNIDEAKFTQVIINLLSNAVKFTNEDGNIRLLLKQDNGQMHIEVQDNGIGIPTDMQPFLFDKFTKAGRPGLKGEPTIGLGMSITKTIVEWHQGRIWLESAEGKGSTFFIRIPLII